MSKEKGQCTKRERGQGEKEGRNWAKRKDSVQREKEGRGERLGKEKGQ